MFRKKLIITELLMRGFIESFGVLSTTFFVLVLFCYLSPTETLADDRPNILWLSTEDIGPEIGCYGDPDAVTPNIDAFAKQGMIYDYAWSNYPVCAPARTTIIGGMYAACNGAGNMRSGVVIPDGVQLFPKYLREAGYYCTNATKEDYNYLATEDTWDQSNGKAHYRNRKDGQPFFAVFNYTGTHESKIRKRPHTPVIDPASVTLKSYWPDIPEVRQDLAQYHDNITTMDKWVQKHLDQLEKSGQADNTIVIFFGDHGGGMPRHKRFAGDSGQRVPFIVHVPEKLKSHAGSDFAPGSHLKRPVGFIDLAPTMLSIAGIKPKEFMQGHAFLGAHQAAAPKYLYGLRDRMDERPDTSRAVRDEKYIYVRNYMPHVPAGQFIGYQQETNTTRIWNEMFKAGKLNEVQSQFWKNHPAEELYDLESDPEETVNLVKSDEHKEVLERFRAEHRASMIRFGDLGLIPEAILLDFGQAKKSRRLVLEDPDQFPLTEIFEIANLAANPEPGDEEKLKAAAMRSSASVRYWGAMGMLIDGQSGFDGYAESLSVLVKDDCASVAIVAAEAMARFGDDGQRTVGIETLKKLSDKTNSNYYASIHALNAVDRLNLGAEEMQWIKSLPTKSGLERGGKYIGQLVTDVFRDTVEGK
jgi:uncharacterized sulfatase